MFGAQASDIYDKGTHSSEMKIGAEWLVILEELKSKFNANYYENWLKHLRYKDFFSGRLVLTAPSRFMRDWINNNCNNDLLLFFKEKDQSIFSLDIIVSSNPDGSVSKTAQSQPVTNQLNDPIGLSPNVSHLKLVKSDSESDEPRLIEHDDLGSRLEPRYIFENFVVGKPNELAYAASLKVAESDQVAFNPLFLYGGVGLGKTHLMHAIAWHIKSNRPNRKVVYLSAEKFMYHFVKALRFKNIMSFKEQFRSVDVLMIDDFQFISGKDSTQEEFFHTFNDLVGQNRQVIMSADKSPSDLEGLEERLRSRLGWGLVADIHPTTYELRLGILTTKAQSIQKEIPIKVLEFLASKVTSNVRELEGALTRIVAHSMLIGREITVESTQDVLRDLLRANDRRVSIDDIQKKVAEHFGIKIADMHSSKRLRSIVRPRQVAMFLSKEMTTLSLPEIGRKFGGKDHTTVMHAVQKIEELICNDRSLAEDLDLLRRVLNSL
jgi:chromosomal replication initiator protein